MTHVPPHLPRLARGAGNRKYLWFLGLAAAGGVLYLMWPIGNPPSPFDLSPHGTTVRGHIPTSTLTLNWKEALPGPVQRILNPAPAARYVICVFAASAANHDCMAGANTLLFESHDAGTIANQPVPATSFADAANKWLYPQGQFAQDVTLTQAALDIPLQWTVAACKNAGALSCVFAAPQTIAMTARDLHINRINQTALTGHVDFVDDIVNEGETTNESFALETRIWEVISIPQPPSPQTDVNAAGVDASDTVVTVNGEEHPVSDYRAGTRPLSELLGIHKASMVSARFARVVPSVPNPDPRATEVAVCDNEPCSLQTPTRPTVLVGWAKVGEVRTRWEFDSTDNETHRSMRAP